MSVFDSVVLSVLPHVPRPIMRRLAARYFAGERLEEAIAALTAFDQRGFSGTVNLLGEHVRTEPEVRSVVSQFVEAAEAIATHELSAYVSVKPTHVGLEASEDLALEAYRDLARACRDRGLFLRVEMEDHPTVDATLRVFEALWREFDNCGVVLQSRLFRTPDDIERLASRASTMQGPLDVRMVKGIYLEPAEIAHTEPGPIRRAFVDCTRQLFGRGARVALATHDGPMAEELFELIRAESIGVERYELQVLMGVQERLWTRWHNEGHPVRVYVPYGPEWRDYSLRRMRKNPQLLRHLIRNTFRA